MLPVGPPPSLALPCPSPAPRLEHRHAFPGAMALHTQPFLQACVSYKYPGIKISVQILRKKENVFTVRGKWHQARGVSRAVLPFSGHMLKKVPACAEFRESQQSKQFPPFSRPLFREHLPRLSEPHQARAPERNHVSENEHNVERACKFYTRAGADFALPCMTRVYTGACEGGSGVSFLPPFISLSADTTSRGGAAGQCH